MTTPSLEDILAVVDNWFAEQVQGPPVSLHTEIYNHMYAARADLRDRLAVAITGEPLAPLAPPPGEAGDPEGEGPGQPETGSAGAGESATGSSKTPSKPVK